MRGIDAERLTMLSMNRFSVLAAVLATIASFWGVLCYLVIFQDNPNEIAVRYFGPGYVVAAGYILRAIRVPSVQFRLLIWITSAVVQGTWLLLSGWEGNAALLLWWSFAFVVSVCGIFFDNRT